MKVNMKAFRYHHDYPQEKIYSTAMDMDLIKRLWGYLRPYRPWVGFAIFLLIISKVIEAFVPIAIGHVTQKILINANAAASIKESLLSTVVLICGIIMGLMILSYALDGVNVYIKSRIGQRSLLKLRLEVYEHIQYLPLKYFDKHSVGQLMTRTIHDVDQVNQMLSESVVPLIGSLVLFIAIAIGIVVLDWRIAVAVAIFLPVLYLLTDRFRMHQRKCYERVRAIVSAMNTFVQEHLMGASTIRNFGLERRERDQFEKVNEDYSTAYLETVDNFGFFIASIDFLQSAFLITGFAILAFTMLPGEVFQAGTFFTLSLYALMFFRPLADLAERYNVLQSAMAASERIFHIMDQPGEPQNPDGIPLGEIESIEFKDVWFAYEKDHWILRGISFRIQKGESVALVGMTGEGKTTVVSLLLQFYKYQKGSILINGREVQEYSLPSLRRQFSLVLQDPVIFSGTVLENIGLFQDISRDKAQEVVNHLGMQELVERFPEGLEAHLAERGKTLSLGEMQLISLARAVAANRSVLILDEATANIDAPAEKIIQGALQKILTHKTAIVIAHRLSTIRDVDRVIVVHRGQIVEEGTHAQLLQLKGVYEKLYRLQFQNI